METTSWILKGLIALLFIFTGVNKIILPKTKLLNNGMKGLKDLDDKQIKTAGILEVLGAIGLIFPTLLNIFPVLSAISALCLGLTMIVAGFINFKLKLSVIPNFVILVFCIFIAYWQQK